MNNVIQDLYLLKKDAEFGYVDKKGHWVVEPIYDFAMSFPKGCDLALVALDGKTGFINSEGVVQIPIEFDDAESFEADGSARVQVGDCYGCIDTSGELIVAAKFTNIGVFSENGLAMAQDGQLSGYINKKGDWIIEPKFSRAWPFEGGLARVLYKECIGVIDSSGSWVVEPKFDHADFVDELIYLEKHIGMKVLAGYATQEGEFLTYDQEQLDLIFADA